MRLACTTLLVTMTLLAGAVEAARIYRWTDAQGKVHYGDQPPAGGQGKEVRPGAAQTVPPPAPQTDKGGDAALRAAACTQKQEQLNQYRSAVRIVETDNLGKQKEYSPVEQQALIQQTQQQIAQLCEAQ